MGNLPHLPFMMAETMRSWFLFASTKKIGLWPLWASSSYFSLRQSNSEMQKKSMRKRSVPGVPVFKNGDPEQISIRNSPKSYEKSIE